MSSEEQEFLQNLQAENLEQKKKIQSLEDMVTNLTNNVKDLQDQVRYYQGKRYGSSSEVMGELETKQQTLKDILPEGERLFDEAEAIAPEEEELETVPAHTRRKPRKRKPLVNGSVPREKVFHRLDHESCECCHGELSELSFNLVREEVVYIPAQVKVLEHYQEVKECRQCRKEGRPDYIKSAPLAPSLVQRSPASASLLAEMIDNKFSQALPLYRQEKIFKRQGLNLDRKKMAHWLIAVHRDWLTPLMKHMESRLLEESHIHIDETPLQVLREEGRKNQQKSYMWVYCSGARSLNPIRLFHYDPSRSGDVPAQFLENFDGSIQTDCYSGYKKVTDVTNCACWVHLRRKFYEAKPQNAKDSSSKAHVALAQIQKLFQLETDWEQLDEAELLRRREEEEWPLVDAFFAWIDQESLSVPPRSALGRAFSYAQRNRENFYHYLTLPEAALSNNLAENAIRPFVVGRKNWLFSGSPRGAETSSALYSLTETAKANGLDSKKYFIHILTELPKLRQPLEPEALDKLMPWDPDIQAICRLQENPSPS